jgi:hypothetical protein
MATNTTEFNFFLYLTNILGWKKTEISETEELYSKNNLYIDNKGALISLYATELGTATFRNLPIPTTRRQADWLTGTFNMR